VTTPIVLPWPLRSGLEVATRAPFDLGDQSSADFLRPAGEAALASPDSVSWRVFKNPRPRTTTDPKILFVFEIKVPQVNL
jgi:uncharacterized protein (DUF2236 family)